MGVNAIDNTNLVGICRFNCGIEGFTPAVSYAYDAAAKTVTLQDGSVIPAGDTFKRAKYEVHDQFGNSVRGTTTVSGGGAGGPQVISVAGLNLSRPLNITATVFTTNGLYADGSAFNIQAAGNLATWDKSN